MWFLLHVPLLGGGVWREGTGGGCFLVCSFVWTLSYFKKLRTHALEIFFFLCHGPWGLGTSEQRETATVTHLTPSPSCLQDPADKELNPKI